MASYTTGDEMFIVERLSSRKCIVEVLETFTTSCRLRNAIGRKVYKKNLDWNYDVTKFIWYTSSIFCMNLSFLTFQYVQHTLDQRWKNIPKILLTTSKLWEPEVWHSATFILIIHKYQAPSPSSIFCMNLSFLTFQYVQQHPWPEVKKYSKNVVNHFKALGARSVTFSNFYIDNSQISGPLCACLSD
jgi:hypothetical protein